MPYTHMLQVTMVFCVRSSYYIPSSSFRFLFLFLFFFSSSSILFPFVSFFFTHFIPLHFFTLACSLVKWPSSPNPSIYSPAAIVNAVALSSSIRSKDMASLYPESHWTEAWGAVTLVTKNWKVWQIYFTLFPCGKVLYLLSFRTPQRCLSIIQQFITEEDSKAWLRYVYIWHDLHSKGRSSHQPFLLLPI